MNIKILNKNIKPLKMGLLKLFSTSTINKKNHSCKILVVGGGSGGCSVAAKLSNCLGGGSVVVVEPSEYHYYQPYFTLVGGGIKKLSDSRKHSTSVLPPKAAWIKDHARKIDPERCLVETLNGETINYEYLVIALGIENNYAGVKGLKEALDNCKSGVSTIYSPDYVGNVYECIKKLKEGEAIFTFPMSPIKCPGAPQKIAYLADHYFSKTGVRNKINITYSTTLPVIFGVKKYADALWKVTKNKNIKVNLQTLLTEVNMANKEAVFMNIETKELSTVRYSMLHVTPPQRPPKVLRENKLITDSTGFLDIDKYTLRHKKYPNIFGIGDCTNTPNSKTAAAVAKQSVILYKNLLSVLSEKTCHAHYDGYASCPLVTGYDKCILAEFNYDLQPEETFPFNQAVERTSMYYMKKDCLPFVYWNLMLKGYWSGPSAIRKCINPLAC